MSDKSLKYRKNLRIEKAEVGERLDRVLAQRCSDVSRSQLTKWIKDGSITVDGELRKPNYRLVGGESVKVDGAFQPKQSWDAAAELELQIVFQDDDLLVIDKPAGLVVHPGAATVAPTLANGLLATPTRTQAAAARWNRAPFGQRYDRSHGGCRFGASEGTLGIAASSQARGVTIVFRQL